MLITSYYGFRRKRSHGKTAVSKLKLNENIVALNVPSNDSSYFISSFLTSLEKWKSVDNFVIKKFWIFKSLQDDVHQREGGFSCKSNQLAKFYSFLCVNV